MQFSRKLQLATDLYQLSMGNVYHNDGKENETAVFDLFIRKNPFEGGYTVAAGLEQVIEYIEGLAFTPQDIAQLRANHPEFSPSFLTYLENFRFEGELYALPEGTVFFPFEPIVRVKAPLIQAQLIETTMLSIINHQSLIATKAARIRQEAGDSRLMEFGLRRAHGTEAGYFGARAALIGGFSGTSNVETEELLGLPAQGTMAHSFIQSYDTELEAFEKYIEYNPNNSILLVDTYHTLEQGVPNAIKAFQKAKAEGRLGSFYGIRIDSGDLAYMSAESRKLLDAAGLTDCLICASSDLDEYLIKDLGIQGAKIDFWGVGTKLITAYDSPALGGVYKLAEIEGKPKLKISEDPFKLTNPGYKKVYRFYDRDNRMALADLITLDEEVIDESKPLTIFDPVHTWKRRKLTNFYVEELLKPIFIDGKCVYERPDLAAMQAKLTADKDALWPAFKRMINPHIYHVDLSQPLWDMKQEILDGFELNADQNS